MLQISAKCQFNEDATTITTKIHECGTTAEVVGNNIVYKNEVRISNMGTAIKNCSTMLNISASFTYDLESHATPKNTEKPSLLTKNQNMGCSS